MMSSLTPRTLKQVEKDYGSPLKKSRSSNTSNSSRNSSTSKKSSYYSAKSLLSNNSSLPRKAKSLSYNKNRLKNIKRRETYG